MVGHVLEAGCECASSHMTDDGPVTRRQRAACGTLRPCPRRNPAASPPPVPRLVIVMPAYNAARTLERTYADIPHDLVHKIILVDDVSRDETVEIARQLGLDVIIHSQNRGYGGNQKTCYDAALAAGAEIVVMLHPGLPVRRDADPGTHRADRRRDARPDARQPVPGRSAGRRDAALEVRQQSVPDRPREPGLRAPPVRVPHRACGPTAAACSRPCRTSSTATTSCSTRS